MLNDKEAQDIMNGIAYLECLANYYECSGTEKGKILFQNVSDDTYILCDYEHLTNTERYNIAYKD